MQRGNKQLGFCSMMHWQFFRKATGAVTKLVVSLMLTSVSAQDQITVTRLSKAGNLKTYEVVGWHWYNQPVREIAVKKKRSESLMQSFNQLSPLQQLNLLKAVTRNRQVKAVLSGKVNDIAAYKAAQDFWVRRATAFTMGWEKMLLRYPSLDYSLHYSHSNMQVPLMQRSLRQREDQAISRLAKDQGLVFFYRGKYPEDRLFSGIVSRFSASHQISVMPVSVDGAVSPVFPQTRLDSYHKKARALGVETFPALVLVNPATNHYQRVSYGVQSESELANRLLKIANHWKPAF